MTIKQAIEYYESFSQEDRMKLQEEFDLIYDNLGDRETKFYRWIKNTKKKKKLIK